MNKLSVIFAIVVILPLLLGAAGMVTIIAAKFSQTSVEQASVTSETITTPAPITDPNCGDGICSKAERANFSCPVDC